MDKNDMDYSLKNIKNVINYKETRIIQTTLIFMLILRYFIIVHDNSVVNSYTLCENCICKSMLVMERI